MFYRKIISRKNLLIAWREFKKNKKYRKDVAIFQSHFLDNIIHLRVDLEQRNYKHGGYQNFKINDPKPRDIHKASVRDRLLHHAIYRVLYPYFDKKFIYHSYASRKHKGTHKALYAFKKMANKVSKNNTKTVWVLKCDIRKFFASIDHNILKSILAKHIHDRDTLNLLSVIIDSFQTPPVIAPACRSNSAGSRSEMKWSDEAISGLTEFVEKREMKLVTERYGGIPEIASLNQVQHKLQHRDCKNRDCHTIARKDSPKGLPLGNLTSQLLVNVYMNEFDQWVKHILKAKYYIRYADDFVILHTDKSLLENYLKDIKIFLNTKLKLQLHSQKVSITTLASGIDFLGWVHFPHHRVLRTITRRRMFKKLQLKEYARESMQSYLGMLKHGNAYGLSLKIKDGGGE